MDAGREDEIRDVYFSVASKATSSVGVPRSSLEPVLQELAFRFHYENRYCLYSYQLPPGDRLYPEQVCSSPSCSWRSHSAGRDEEYVVPGEALLDASRNRPFQTYLAEPLHVHGGHSYRGGDCAHYAYGYGASWRRHGQARGMEPGHHRDACSWELAGQFLEFRDPRQSGFPGRCKPNKCFLAAFA